MAEFTEVMRQATRMCEAHDSCARCALYKARTDGGCSFDKLYNTNYDEVERRIRAWAQEHPEPVYPTWRKWYDATFPEAVYRRICPATFGDEYTDCGKDACGLCVERTIPAEIAEKLGIKPITPDKAVPEHDGCDKCKYEHVSCNDEPCKRCRGNRGGTMPDLFEEG